ncbi:MAG: tetratricopeptide repeat protein [Saprospiraceae bacterium]|nr:tetratricopeptide repeat protein [Saprospiraceae bacterium]MDW8230284.1 tetratricopeptide repeat protein [Saprospiraceae bacterium]
MSSRLQQLMALWEANSTDAFLLFAIAKEHEKAGNDAEALAWYERLRQTDPAYVGLYYHLGRLYERSGRPQDAIEAYRTGMHAAKQAGDLHAWAELNAARMEIDPNDDDF